MAKDGVPSVKLYNGYEMPILGLGTWRSQPGEVKDAVMNAIDIGYRHFDTAYVYRNEKEVGEAIREKISEGIVQRDDVFVTSKLWSTFFRKELVVPALKETLANLGLQYLDLYLVHCPMGAKEGDEHKPLDSNGKIIPGGSHFTEVWKGMEECVKLGLTRSIGISNFSSKQIEELLRVAEIRPVTNQVECHPFLNQSQLIKFCQERGITITAYSPLGAPARPSRQETDPVIIEDQTVLDLASKYGKSPAQLLIRYQIQRGIPVIPKSVTKARIESNFNVFDFAISDADMQKLNSLNKNARLVKFEWFDQHKDYPFNDEF